MFACILCWDNHITYDFLHVDGMVDDVGGGCINIGAGIVVDVGDELCELAIELVFPLPHGFGEEGFDEGGIGVGVTHSLKLLGSCLPSQCVSEMEGNLVGVGSVDTSFVGYKVNSSPKNVYGFVNPLSVDNNIETLNMAPTCLLVLRMVGTVGEVKADYVVIFKLVLEGHDYDVWISLGGRLLAIKVVIMRSCKGVVDSLSVVMLMQSFSILED